MERHAATKSWRVAFLRRRFSPTGGAERYLLRLASGLAARGHQVTLYCEDWSPRENPFESVRKIEAGDPVSFARKAASLPLHERHDIVFSLERVPGCDIYRAGDGLHVEWLAHRKMFSPVAGLVRTLLRSKNRELCRLEAEVFQPKGVGRVICNSHFVAEQVARRFDFPHERIDVIYNGVPYQQFSSGDRALGRKALQLNPDDYVVLLVGAGRERKGHAFARRAMEGIRKKYAKLVIVDSPPPVAMPHVYAAADVFLLPTIYDPFANVTLEALAAGLPVITSAQNGASEIITEGKNGFILKRADDVSKIVQLLDELADPERRLLLREPAQTLAREYDLGRNLTATLAAFDKLSH
ncbi:MAG: glycosyltransferase family 4 protein [Methylacidiphilales bacterium]|nr:glycosyltransferase family 4 protein [Candidatus Methylacidiphilales bacterium]